MSYPLLETYQAHFILFLDCVPSKLLLLMFTKDQSKFKRVIECSHILGKSLPEIRRDLKT